VKLPAPGSGTESVHGKLVAPPASVPGDGIPPVAPVDPPPTPADPPVVVFVLVAALPQATS
jgi:hypothetical protein